MRINWPGKKNKLSVLLFLFLALIGLIIFYSKNRDQSQEDLVRQTIESPYEKNFLSRLFVYDRGKFISSLKDEQSLQLLESDFSSLQTIMQLDGTFKITDVSASHMERIAVLVASRNEVHLLEKSSRKNEYSKKALKFNSGKDIIIESIVITNEGNIFLGGSSKRRGAIFSLAGHKLDNFFLSDGVSSRFFHDLAADSKGNIYGVDSLTYTVHKISGGGRREFVLGVSEHEDENFINPISIFLDREAQVFVADNGNSKVKMFSKDGKLLKVWASDRGIESPHSIVGDGVRKIFIQNYLPYGNSIVEIDIITEKFKIFRDKTI